MLEQQIKLSKNCHSSKVIDAIREINSNGGFATITDIYGIIPDAPKPSIRRAVNELQQEKYQKIVKKIPKEFGVTKYGYAVNKSVKVEYYRAVKSR